MDDPQEIRRRVRRKKPQPPTPPPPETREGRLLRKLSQAMDAPEPQTNGLTPAQRAGYQGSVRALIYGLHAGAFRRRWKRDRAVLRRVQILLGRWFEGTTDAVPDEFAPTPKRRSRP